MRSLNRNRMGKAASIAAVRGERRGGSLRADGIENLTCSLLDVFEALCEELRVAAVEPDIVLGRGSGLETDCTANHKCDGLRLGFPNSF